MLSAVFELYRSFSRSVSWWDAFWYAVIFTLSYVLYWLVIKPLTSPLRKIPGLPFKPIIGNVWEMVNSEPLEITLKHCTQYGPIHRFYFAFGEERLAVCCPEGLKQVFVTNAKHYKKPELSFFKYFAQIFGKGLVFINGTEHLKRKKALNPIFKHGAIREMSNVFFEYGAQFIQLWSDQLGNQDMVEIDVTKDLICLTLDIIGECTFGYKFHSLKPGSEDAKITKAFCNLTGGAALSWKLLIPLYTHFLNKKLQSDINVCHEVVNELIEEKIKKHKEQGYSAHDLLDHLMSIQDENGSGLTERELHDEVLTFLFAGHETSSTAMGWFLLNMADHPEIQDKIRQELNAVLPSDGSPLTLEHLDELKYLPCAIKETLRLHPPVPSVFREAAVDTYLCGHFVPRGTKLICMPGAMMRLPQYWKDPLTFNPDRFLDDQEIKPFTWLPFVTGLRMCIGYKFALNEMKTSLALILKNFKVSHVPGTTYRARQAITMKPTPNLKLRIRRATDDNV